MTSLRNIHTTTYLIAFVITMLAAIVLEWIGEELLLNTMLFTPQEVASSILSGIALFGLFALVPVSAFRPRNRFSIRGDCRQRAKVFTCTVAVLIAMYVWAVLAIVSVF